MASTFRDHASCPSSPAQTFCSSRATFTHLSTVSWSSTLTGLFGTTPVIKLGDPLQEGKLRLHDKLADSLRMTFILDRAIPEEVQEDPEDNRIGSFDCHG